MQFRKLTDEEPAPLLPPGEDAYRIDYGYGAVLYAACWTDRDTGAAASMFGMIGAARAIQSNGNPVLRQDGSMIFGRHAHGVLRSKLIVNGMVDEACRQSVVHEALAGAIRHLLEEVAIEAMAA